MQEAGDFLIPLAEGAIAQEHFLAELGQLLCAKKQGRISDGDITVFESLGLAVEDLAAAYYIYQQQCEKA
jgi:ornithine cyclodeaminase